MSESPSFVVYRRLRQSRAAWEAFLGARTKGALYQTVALLEMGRDTLDEPEYDYQIRGEGEATGLEQKHVPAWARQRIVRQRL